MKATTALEPRQARERLLTDRDQEPAYPEIIVANIPEELRAENRWLGWRWKWTGKKWTKPPYCIQTLAKCDGTNPLNWCSFENAMWAVNRGDFHGIGFALGDGYVGVDFDGCYDPEPAELHGDVPHYVDVLRTYTEISPSGHGIKCLCKGKLPAGSREDRAGTVEMYDSGRYFAITGHFERASAQDHAAGAGAG